MYRSWIRELDSVLGPILFVMQITVVCNWMVYIQKLIHTQFNVKNSITLYQPMGKYCMAS